jgi:hypothetical protein
MWWWDDAVGTVGRLLPGRLSSGGWFSKHFLSPKGHSQLRDPLTHCLMGTNGAYRRGKAAGA